MRPALKASWGRIRVVNGRSCPAAGGVGGGVRGGETEHQASDHGHAGRHAGGDTQDEHEEQAAAARVGHPRREVGRAEDGERRGERRHGERRDRHGSPHRPVAGQPGCGARFVAGGADGGVEQVAVERARHRARSPCRERRTRCTDRTPGTARSALVTRFSQEVHVIPVTGTVSDNGGARRPSSCPRSASRCVPAGPIVPSSARADPRGGTGLTPPRDAQNRFQRSATA